MDAPGNSAVRTAGVAAFVLLAGALVVSCVQHESWTHRKRLTYPTGNLEIPVLWTAERGVHIRIVDGENRRAVQIELRREGAGLRLAPEEAFAPAAQAGMSFYPGALPEADQAIVDLVLKIRQETWGLYIDRQPVFLCPAPFVAPATVYQPPREVPGEARTRYQKVKADFRFTDAFLQPDGDDEPLSQWEIESGRWRLHTAADNAVLRRDVRGDGKRPKPGFSPNFYSLKGHGTGAVVTAGYDFYDNYRYEAAVQVDRSEAGLVFYLHDLNDYYGFTVSARDRGQALLRLWRCTSSNDPVSDVLGAVEAPLFPGQWARLGVQSFPDRIVCLLDSAVVLDLRLPMPLGGRFGLYVNGDGHPRFDDVSAVSHHDLDLRTVGELRRHCLRAEGNILDRGGLFGLGRAPDGDAYLAPRRSRRAQWVVVGSPQHEGHVFSARFDLPGETSEVGLIAGYTGERRPYYLFTRQATPRFERFLLSRVATNRVEALEILNLPGPPAARAATSLLCDAAGAGELRLYRDGELVLVHHPGEDVPGAAGLYVGPATRARISDVRYLTERQDVYHSQYEKNPVFIEDPFMRHWSSPEGQWLTMKDGLTWHKGDFLGRFLVRMPFVPGSRIHLGVREGRTNGVAVVAAREDAIDLLGIAPGTGPDASPGAAAAEGSPALADPPADAVLASAPAGLLRESNGLRWFTVHHEGYWLWLTSGDTTLFKRRLARAFEGRRIRIEGYTLDQLKHSYVERYNVKDFLFKESLHEWVINGGKWEVINRFNCQPRWSHMNGESAEGLAALWSKYTFGGDFCVEMYAGTRHQWYERCGDLNLTIMNRDTTPSHGYSVTCTGWDPDHSQRMTRLYRNGRAMASSDWYLVPRTREGSRRLGYNPLVHEGRDVHGAWYYIKLRRLGKRLEYYFDNQLILTAEDPDPLDAGSLGIWTYMNSMMVARVKVAAERIERKPPVFRRVSPGDRAAPALPARPPRTVVLAGGHPLEADRPGDWEADDPIGRAGTSWHATPGGTPYFVTTSTLGGGEMLTRCTLPPVPYRALAGWRFDVGRTPGARFNFHYSVGHRDKEGQYVPQYLFFHRLSGAAFSAGTYERSGATDLAPSRGTGQDWHARAEWATVHVWVPANSRSVPLADPDLLVRVEGFGNRQPSYVAQGLTGNAPGEAYAVKRFEPVRYGPPPLIMATNAPPLDRVSMALEGRGDSVATFRDLVCARDWCEKVSRSGIVRARMRVQTSAGVDEHRLAWIDLPARPEMDCAWSRTLPDTVELRSAMPFPDRRFAWAQILAGDVQAETSGNGLARRVIPVPRLERLAAADDRLPLAINTGDDAPATFTLHWSDRSVPDPPALLGIEGCTPFLQTFERRTLEAPLEVDRARMALGHYDPRQGSFLRVFNPGRSARLRSEFAWDLSLSRYPALQFRYRGAGMSNVSVSLNRRHRIKFTENDDRAVAVRGGPDPVLDGTWRTWRGIIADAVTGGRLRMSLFDLQWIGLGSMHGVDQTGLFSEWALDDVVFGPAVSGPGQLAFTPDYFDFDGVASVSVAVRGGAEGFDELSEADRGRLAWHDHAHGARVEPDLAGVGDGWGHIFVKGRDRLGHESPVTDIPFLLDRKPPTSTHEIVATDAPLCNGTVLRVALDGGGGAPLDLAGLKLLWNETPLVMRPLGSKATHGPNSDELYLNWPYLCRRQLDKSGDGEQASFVIAEIADGAGNRAGNVSVPITVDYASDETPPTVLSTRYPDTILCFTDWRDKPPRGGRRRVRFAGTSKGKVEWVREPGKAPYFSTLTAKKRGEVAVDVQSSKWILANHPYLAFRIRRPKIQDGEKTRIDMVLDLSDGKSCEVSLTHDDKGKRRVPLPEPIPWRENVWFSVTLDLRNLLRELLTETKLAKLEVRRIRFSRSDAPDELPLHLQDLFVFTSWQEGDKVRVLAYDASGMAGITTDYLSTDGMLFLPTVDGMPAPPNGWMELKARDRAGNLSHPVRFPFHGTNVPLDSVIWEDEDD